MVDCSVPKIWGLRFSDFWLLARSWDKDLKASRLGLGILGFRDPVPGGIRWGYCREYAGFKWDD